MATPHPWELDVEGAAKAMSMSPDGALVAVGGRNLFRLAAVAGGQLTDVRSVRAPARSRSSLNWATNDIRWHPQLQCKHLLASAATNGAIILWNLGQGSGSLARSGVRQTVLGGKGGGTQKRQGHTQQANRVCWHGAGGDPKLLLSAAQDGIVKLWDTDNQQLVNNFRPRPNDAVRDVQFR
jgi:WD40 repeat protein